MAERGQLVDAGVGRIDIINSGRQYNFLYSNDRFSRGRLQDHARELLMFADQDTVKGWRHYIGEIHEIIAGEVAQRHEPHDAEYPTSEEGIKDKSRGKERPRSPSQSSLSLDVNGF